VDRLREFLILQTTLLTVAVAIILALVAALVGPLFVDWGAYRALIEREATHLVGLDTHVNGKIDARLLPSPQITLHDITLGDGAGKVHVGALDIEFALGPLLRGQWNATELRLTGPQVRLALDGSGHIEAPTPAIGFKPDTLSIQKLSIVDGEVTLVHAASGGTVTLDKLYFNGEAKSLLGPFSGEGDVIVAGDHYPYRISAGRVTDADTLTLRLNVDPRDRPLNFQADGTLSFDGGPHFKGNLSLARATGIVTQKGGSPDQPWRVHGKIDASTTSALMQNAEFDYGSGKQTLKLTGVANVSFGKHPHFKGELTGHQIDLDRLLGGANGRHSSPAAALRKLAELASGAFRPPMPMQIGLGIDRVTLAGDALQNVRGDVAADSNGWDLTSFEFRAPGFTQARLSGHLTIANSSVTFRGPAEIDSNDPKALAAWLEGRAAPAQSSLRQLSLRGDVTLGSERLAVEHLTAGFAGKTIAGRLAYAFPANGQPSKLDAALSAPEIDLDAVLGFGHALFAGSSLVRPKEMTIVANIGRGTIAGLEGRDISAKIKVDADHWQVDKLSVADLGGAAFSASGRIALTGSSPQGSMRVDLDAPDLAPVATVLNRFEPKMAQALSVGAPAMAPAKLHGQLTVDGKGPAQFAVNGSLGQVRLSLDGNAAVDFKAFRVGNIRLNGKLAADDGKPLLTMLGLDSALAVGVGPGALTLKATGPAGGTLRVASRLTANGLDAGLDGTASPFAAEPAASLRARVVEANAAPLRRTGEAAKPVPISFVGRVAISGDSLALRHIHASVAGSALSGDLTVGLATPHRVQGDIQANSADALALIAPAIGMPMQATHRGAGWNWPSQPFSAGMFGDFTGKVSLKARRLAVLPTLTAREFQATLNLGQNEVAIADIGGVVSDGHIGGGLTFRSGADGVMAQGKITLSGSDAAGLLASAARPPVAGTLGLSIEAQGAGLSPVALIGSLEGKGKITLKDGEFAGLDPRAFDAVTHAVDQGLPVESDKIAGAVRRALDSGQLSVKRLEGAILIKAGQVRLSDVTADGENAGLTLGGNLDLLDGTIDARLVLSGTNQAAGVRPDIYMALKGPVAKPTRSIDVSALSGWLTLRAIDNQAKRVHDLEESARKQREAEQKRRDAEEKRRDEAEARRAELTRKRQEAELQRLDAEQQRREAARMKLSPLAVRRGGGAAIAAPIFMPPAELSPRVPAINGTMGGTMMTGTMPATTTEAAPALPAPIEIHPPPQPRSAPASTARNVKPIPEASVGPQH
jgi:large subunit ribosomal protein L24